MDDLIRLGQSVLSKMILDVGISGRSKRVELNPIVEESKTGEDSSEWDGLHYVYTTDLTPSTRVQIVFGVSTLNFFPVLSPTMAEIDPISLDRFREEQLPEFGNHPDMTVKDQVISVVSRLYDEGYEIRILPWWHEVSNLEDRDQLAGLSGLFFPIVHMVDRETDSVALIRTEPVIQVRLESEI